MIKTYDTKDKILENILLINFDEEKKLYKDEKNSMQLSFRTKIQNLFTNKKNSIKNYAIIVVCTQNSLSGTDDHFQESFQKMITRKEDGFNFELLSKVDATRQCNRRSGSLMDCKKAYNVRTRVYYDPDKVNLNFDLSKFEKSYNITSTNKSRFGFGSNQSWTNTRIANNLKVTTNNISKNTDFSKIQLFDYDIFRLSGQDGKNAKIGEGLIDINMYFIYKKNTFMRFTIRNHTIDNIEAYKLSNERHKINYKVSSNSSYWNKAKSALSQDDAYLYTCTPQAKKNIIKNNRHPTKITIFNKNNIKLNKPVSVKQVIPEEVPGQEYAELNQGKNQPTNIVTFEPNNVNQINNNTSNYFKHLIPMINELIGQIFISKYSKGLTIFNKNSNKFINPFNKINKPGYSLFNQRVKNQTQQKDILKIYLETIFIINIIIMRNYLGTEFSTHKNLKSNNNKNDKNTLLKSIKKNNNIQLFKEIKDEISKLNMNMNTFIMNNSSDEKKYLYALKIATHDWINEPNFSCKSNVEWDKVDNFNANYEISNTKKLDYYVEMMRNKPTNKNYINIKSNDFVILINRIFELKNATNELL